MLNAQSAFSSLWSNAFCLMLTYRKLGIHRRMDSASVLSIDTEPSRVHEMVLEVRWWRGRFWGRY